MKKLLFIGLLLNYSFALKISIPKELQSNVSISIIDSKTANTIFNYHESMPMLLASNVKLFTTLFGLNYLGADFHWSTQLKYNGKINNQILDGNLYIQGGGDPSLDSANMYQLLSQLKRLHITTITGNVILDSSIFNTTSSYSMLQTNWYDADKIVPSGLIINKNRAKFTIHINNNNITISHNLYGINVINYLHIDQHASICDLDNSMQIKFINNSVTLIGNISPLCNNIATNFMLMDNFKYNKMVIAQIFKDFNIKINGQLADSQTPKNAKLIDTHQSQNLAQIIYDMNKFSDNLYAETIISSVGAFKTNNLDTFNDGGKVYYKFLHNNNWLNTKFKLENGAGLSRYEYFTANNVSNLLYQINSSIIFASIVENSLPIAMSEGSLHNKFNNFSGRFKAKTGTLNDTKSYCGVFYSKNSHKYIVVFIANNLYKSADKLLFTDLVNHTLNQLDTLTSTTP